MAYDVLGFIIEFAFEFIPRYFGALMKWIYLGFEIPYIEVLKQKGNTKIGAASLGIVILFILLIVNFGINK